MSTIRTIYLKLPNDYITGSPHKRTICHICECRANVGTSLHRVYLNSDLGQFHSSHGVILNSVLYVNNDGITLDTVPGGTTSLEITMKPSLILFYKPATFHYLFIPTYHQVQVDGDQQHVKVRLYHDDGTELDQNELIIDKVKTSTLVDLRGAFANPTQKQSRWKRLSRSFLSEG